MLNPEYQEPSYVISRAGERRRIHDTARRLVDYGFYVFPVVYRGKVPACPSWPSQATRNRAAVKAWFGGSLHNIGVAMKSSRVVGIDIDRTGAFDEAEQEFPGIWTPTLTVITGKGRHLYYEAPDAEIGNGRGQLPAGIDVRGVVGDGGYLVGPGSRHVSGTLYEVEDWDVPLAPMPPVLAEVLTPAPRPAPAVRKSTGGGLAALVPLVAVVLEAVRRERNEKLHWAACRAVEEVHWGFYQAAEAYTALLAAALDVGLSEHEAARTISGVFRRSGVQV
ncbi:MULTISPECIES: bifunctional DNA primase/polymerase [Streptomyces]|uniref:bifunctional DNA primase/polymerase n=1 Tax=Streptomyces TaxID=1883 RepID=UPI00345B9AB7